MKFLTLLLAIGCLVIPGTTNAQKHLSDLPIDSLVSIANGLDTETRRDSIITLLQLALEKTESVQDDTLRQHYRGQIGEKFYLMVQYDLAKPILEQQLEYEEGRGNTIRSAELYPKLARILRNQGNPTGALELAQKGLQAALEVKDTFNMIESYQMMTAAYLTVTVIDTAAVLNNSSSMYELAVAYGQNLALAKAGFINGIGNLIAHNFKTAVEMFTISSDQYLLLGDTVQSMAALTKIGNVYELKQEIEKAIPYYERYYEYTRENGGFQPKLNAIMYLAYAIITLEDPERVRREALPLLDEAMRFESLKSLRYEYTLVMGYYKEAYRILRDYESAFFWADRMMAYKDSTLNEQHSKTLAELQTKYETDKKEQEIRLMAEQQKVQEARIAASLNRNILLGALLLIALLVGGLYYYRNRLEQQLKMQNMRSQISSDLHDEVGSSLTRISMIMNAVKVTDDEQSRQYFEKGNEILMESITKIRDVVWAIDARNDQGGDLLDRMEDFAYDMFTSRDIAYRFEHQHFDRKAILPPLIRQNIYLIFKEAVTNVIKHSNATSVDISLQQRDNRIHLTIKDNGQGIHHKKVAGSGLVSMQLRAERIGGRLNYEQQPDGFFVRLEV
ncbi:sensor histidine kinase [Flavilitoribacter nigricans]|uniref:histidine kinase n=1 Tax=Flavilitoribacter nigricans (strain ATCC 23147 / DSM 23189 / NBRC 102662 / NCIMB 1420 / SS-2) TaxID=1122177 RepID=A0A2D0N0W8_FLAN2|nr:ATP-binding protein [Flavilitoribacter nigricans]PHN02154.1 hypothetical protein CRP01_33740 [Flavilitoribacter nigricans DSM 23189 = NBRC 102662]